MSLVGKEVSAIVYNDNGSLLVQGIVMDKYSGIEQSSETSLEIDFYILKTASGLEHVPCSSVNQVAG